MPAPIRPQGGDWLAWGGAGNGTQGLLSPLSLSVLGVSISGKSKEAEIKRINKELANIRSKFKGERGPRRGGHQGSATGGGTGGTLGCFLPLSPSLAQASLPYLSLCSPTGDVPPSQPPLYSDYPCCPPRDDTPLPCLCPCLAPPALCLPPSVSLLRLSPPQLPPCPQSR